MLLALDIGNTNITAGVFDSERLAAQWRLSTQRDRTADELAAFLKVVFETRDLRFSDVQGVAVSSVVPSLTPQAEQLSTRYFNCEPLIVGPDTDTGLIKTTQSARSGSRPFGERAAAWKKFKHRCRHCRFGTATTWMPCRTTAIIWAAPLHRACKSPPMRCFALRHALPRVELVRLNKPWRAIPSLHAERNCVGLRRAESKSLWRAARREMPSQDSPCSQPAAWLNLSRRMCRRFSTSSRTSRSTDCA
jgi:type III pantothenate kinase